MQTEIVSMLEADAVKAQSLIATLEKEAPLLKRRSLTRMLGWRGEGASSRATETVSMSRSGRG